MCFPLVPSIRIRIHHGAFHFNLSQDFFVLGLHPPIHDQTRGFHFPCHFKLDIGSPKANHGNGTCPISRCYSHPAIFDDRVQAEDLSGQVLGVNPCPSKLTWRWIVHKTPTLVNGTPTDFRSHVRSGELDDHLPGLVNIQSKLHWKWP